MPYVRERVSNELLLFVKTAGHMLYFESPDGRLVGLLSDYEKYLQPEEAKRLRKQMDRVVSTSECHEFINDLMCLGFGVCNQDKQECRGDEPRRIKSLRVTSWGLPGGEE
jgi:hypothetical protein